MYSVVITIALAFIVGSKAIKVEDQFKHVWEEALLTESSVEAIDEETLFGDIVRDMTVAGQMSLRASLPPVCKISSMPGSPSKQINLLLLTKCLSTKAGKFSFSLQSVNPIAPVAACQSIACPSSIKLDVYSIGTCFQPIPGAILLTTISMVEGKDSQFGIACSDACPFTFVYNNPLAPGALLTCLPSTGYICSKLVLPFCAN